MLLTCDNCQTIFRIDSSKLNPSGQRVRCSVCAHSWVAAPVADIADNPDDVGETLRALRLPIFILLFLIVIGGALTTMRGVITAHLPGLMPAYDLVGLSIRPDLATLEIDDIDADYFGDVLRLKGGLANISGYRVHAAPLQVTVTDEAGLIIATSRVIPEARFIDAHDRTGFFVQLDMPPGQQAEISITPIAERLSPSGF